MEELKGVSVRDAAHRKHIYRAFIEWVSTAAATHTPYTGAHAETLRFNVIFTHIQLFKEI